MVAVRVKPGTELLDWVVTVRWPEPVIHSVPVHVEAPSAEAAREIVWGMRTAQRWPKDCTYTARPVDRSTYAPHELDSAWAMFDRAFPMELRP